ncbi:DNA polymerase sigma-like protein [Trypanosoma grayi]|uniref:DNA polymerase sigma-like protein n=1 Tax=Trypanosoma grayi TaxID=71804 RepID=UPI0004F4AC3D|nr:DNA polymerase sigma-like protein [Trypanosoma grayi]KEG11568.1 DNA polymerase sigma-like protein [Trypanosoma grayi]
MTLTKNSRDARRSKLKEEVASTIEVAAMSSCPRNRKRSHDSTIHECAKMRREEDGGDGRAKKRAQHEKHRSPVPQERPANRDGTESDTLPLETVLIAFLKAITPSMSEREQTRRVLHDVSRSLTGVGLRVDVFGSWCTGLCIPSSDIDFVASPTAPAAGSSSNTASGRGSVFQRLLLSFADESIPKRERRGYYSGALRQVANSLRSFGAFHSLILIPHAKVPIVKAVHRNGQKIDVSFHKDGLLTSQFLCEEFKKPQFRLARGLIILVKALVANWRLDDPSRGGLGSFPIAVLVLWFLHSEVTPRYPPECSNSYAVCLVGLLKYYGTQFDSKRTGIDYARKCTINKAPSSELCIMNPVYPHTNCAVAATLFASNVVPRFREMYERFSKLLDYTASKLSVERVVAHAFGRSINAVGGSSLLRQANVTTDTNQHRWETQTHLYAGDPLGL